MWSPGFQINTINSQGLASAGSSGWLSCDLAEPPIGALADSPGNGALPVPRQRLCVSHCLWSEARRGCEYSLPLKSGPGSMAKPWRSSPQTEVQGPSPMALMNPHPGHHTTSVTSNRGGAAPSLRLRLLQERGAPEAISDPWASPAPLPGGMRRQEPAGGAASPSQPG